MTQRQTNRSRVMRRIGVALAATIAVSTVASTAGQAAPVASAAPKVGGEVKVAIFDTFPGFCVGNNPANSSLMATRTMYEGLVEKTVGGDFVGLLAKSFYPSADLKTWTFDLREGVKFHDGAAFDAAAVVTNFQFITGTAGLAGKTYALGTNATFSGNIVSYKATGPMQVTFTLFRAQNDFPGTVYASGRTFMRSPAQLVDGTTCANKPIGTGPFKMVSFTTDTLVVEKNASYWRKDPVTNAQLPYLDKISFTNVKEGSQRAAAVRKGTYDVGQFSSGGDGTFIKDLRQRKSAVTEYKSAAEYYPSLWLNQGKPGSPFASINARKAVLTCIDSANYIKVRTKGEGTMPKSLVGPKSTMFSTKGYPKFSVAESKVALDLWNAEPGNAGKTLTFSFPADASSQSTGNAIFLQRQWAKCGITATYNVEESAKIIGKAFNASPKVAAGEYYNAYDAISILLFEGTDVTFNLPFIVTNAYPAGSTNPVAPYFRSSLGSILGLNHHNDLKVDELFYAGEASADPALAKLKFAEGTAYLQTNYFMSSIQHQYYTMFTTKKIVGIGKLKLPEGKTQRIVTNWGIDWAGISKK